MGHVLLAWTSIFALLAAIGCDSRALSRRHTGVFPSLTATVSKTGVREDPLEGSRARRSASPGHPAEEEIRETDALDLADFIVRHGLSTGGDGEDGGPLPVGRERQKRQDKEGNDLSWLLDQDAWEKVDDGYDLDWDNISLAEFLPGEEEASAARDRRDTDRGSWERRVSEDAVHQRIQKLAEDIRKRRKEIEDEYQIVDESSVGGGSSGEVPGENDSPKRRRRSTDDGTPAVEAQGRIDMFFQSAPAIPSATVILQKDPLPSNSAELPPPIYFCGTKTDPDNPDSVSGEVSETMAL